MSTASKMAGAKKTSCACCAKPPPPAHTFTPPAMLQRKTGMPRRSSGLCRKSRKARRGKREQREAYAAAGDAEQCWCSICGRPGEVERSHHYPQGNYPQHRNDERNWLVVGKHCGCHQLFENKKPLFAKKHPDVWAAIIGQMQAVDLKAYAFYSATTPELYPAL